MLYYEQLLSNKLMKMIASLNPPSPLICKTYICFTICLKNTNYLLCFTTKPQEYQLLQVSTKARYNAAHMKTSFSKLKYVYSIHIKSSSTVVLFC